MQDIRHFLKEVITLKTVWIDKGEGKWIVKRRMHPFLRCFLGLAVIAAGASVYLNMPSFKAEAEPEAKVARLIDYAPDKAIQERLTMPNNNGIIITEPEKLFKPLPKVQARPDKDKDYDYDSDYDSDSKGKYRILVSKSKYTLSLFKGSKLVKEYPIAVGKNPGDKRRVGDHRTPTGDFKIVSIEDASKWKHDFGDGKGKIAGAYGPWFLRLDAKGWKGIGIHGTHDPDSRGTMATEGCIRLSNEDIAELKEKYAYRNMPVTISEN